MGKNTIKKKLGCKINETRHALQPKYVNHQVATSWPLTIPCFDQINTLFISATSFTPNLKYNYTILHPNCIFLITIINAYPILVLFWFWIMMTIYIFYHKQFKLTHILLELLMFKVMQQNELIRPWVGILMQHKTLIYDATFQLNHCTLL